MGGKKRQRRHALTPASAVEVQYEIDLRKDLSHEEVGQTFAYGAVRIAGILAVQVEVVLGQRTGMHRPKSAGIDAGQQDDLAGHALRVQLPGDADGRRDAVVFTAMDARCDQQGLPRFCAVDEYRGHFIILALARLRKCLAHVGQTPHRYAQRKPFFLAWFKHLAEYPPDFHRTPSYCPEINEKRPAPATCGSRPFYCSQNKTIRASEIREANVTVRHRQVFWLMGHRIHRLPGRSTSDILASALQIQRRPRAGFSPASFFSPSLERSPVTLIQL